MSRIMRECREARDAVRPSVKVLWPGMVNWQFDNPTEPWSNWPELANASDGAGGIARDHVDGFGHHVYVSPGTSALQIAIYYAKARTAVTQMGHLGKPMYMTECGFTDGSSTSDAIASRSFGWIYLISAAYGYEFVNPWQMDITSSNWAGHSPWLNSSFRQVHDYLSSNLIGKTVRWAYVMNDGSVRVGCTGDTLVQV